MRFRAAVIHRSLGPQALIQRSMYPLVWAQFHNILTLDKEICILARVEVKYTKVGSNNLCLLVKHKLRGLNNGILRDLSRYF